MKIATSLVTLALAALALPAHAQWYAGGSVGRSKASLDSGLRDDQLFDLGFNGASTSVDDKGTAFRAFGGYRFHRYFAAELGYVDLGRYELRSTVARGSLNSSLRSRGIDLSALGLLPVGESFTLFGRVGVLAARTRSSFSSSGSVALIGGSESERSSGVLYGLGGMADVAPNLALRVEYTEHRKVGDDLSGDFKARTITAGVQYRF